MSRGYVVTWDALIALSFVLFLMVGFIGVQYFGRVARGGSAFERAHAVAENAMDTMNRQGVLEEIAQEWALGNNASAGNLTKEYFDNVIPPQMGYRLEAVTPGGVKAIYGSGDDRPPEEDATDQTKASRHLSGYKEDAPRSGWTGRAWLIENQSWSVNLVSNRSSFFPGWESVSLKYSPVPLRNNTFYLLVPGGSSLKHASFNVSWEGGSVPSYTTLTSSSSSSSSSSTSSSSTTEPRDCHDCPPGEGCGTPGWHEMSGDDYNYHNFTIGSGDSCNLNLNIYREPANHMLGFNLYDIYFNRMDYCEPCPPDDPNCQCMCSHPESRPDLRPWDCETIDIFYESYESCPVPDLPPGTYEIMVDCWNPEGISVDFCPGRYYVYVTSDGGDNCPNDPPPSFSTSTSTAATTVEEPGMIAHWKFDESTGQIALDSIGDHDGTLYGPERTDDAVDGRALYFTGTGDLVSVPDDSALDLAEFTLVAWIKMDSSAQLDNYPAIVGKGTGGNSNRNYRMGVIQASGTAEGGFHNTAGGWISVEGDYVGDNTWHHVVLTYDRSHLRIYVDGEEPNSLPATGTPATNNEPLEIGNVEGDDLKGIVDDVRMYNYALDAGEVQSIYDETRPDNKGDACTEDSDCMSGNCAPDYDGDGSWCAPAGNCAHSPTSSCDETCYGYRQGDYGADCIDDTHLHQCDPDGNGDGVWGIVLCPVCSPAEPEPKDTPCIGRWMCQDTGGHASCDAGCTRDGAACDFCGSYARDTPGSDTWYDGECLAGVCETVKIECQRCMSCRNLSQYECLCTATGGVNNYVYGEEDNVGPNTCYGTQYCDGAGGCLSPVTCSNWPINIIYESDMCSDSWDCDDDGSEDGNHTRLSWRNHGSGDYYIGGWHEYDDPVEEWTHTNRDDDDVSIGVEQVDFDGSPYVHHGSSFDFTAYVGEGVDTLSFGFSAMPRGNCYETVELYASGTLLGSCDIGGVDCNNDNLLPPVGDSVWHYCTIDVSGIQGGGPVTPGAVNTFNVEFPLLPGVSGPMGCSAYPCTMFIDAIGITCG